MLEHGGKLDAAALRYGISVDRWLDLSTGINPHLYAPPDIPCSFWGRLPQEEDGLEQAARAYYGTQDLLAVAGSQAAIQALPRLRFPGRVGVLLPGYAEHAHAWRLAGHTVCEVGVAEIDGVVANLDVLALIQPNNPTGVLFELEQLRRWHERLAARDGWLIVDEAFIEATTASSVIEARMPPGLIVLRSIGKFFGLAGARLGFVAAPPSLLSLLHERLGPWCVNGPARYAMQVALRDQPWQLAMRQRLQREGARLSELLQQAGLPPSGGCGLFQWVQCKDAAALHDTLARQGILTRLFSSPASLRFGLPGHEVEWERLKLALQDMRRE